MQRLPFSFVVLCFVFSAHTWPFAKSHPHCTSQNPPSIPDPALTICKYNAYPGSCCNASREHSEVWYPRGRILAVSGTTESNACRNMISNLLCSTCNPLEAHIFGDEVGMPQIWPYLCVPFCERFYNTCADLPMNTNVQLYVPFRIPGMTANTGTKTIRSMYPTVDSYCSQFGSIDRGSCHTDKPGELPGPPPAPDRIAKLSVPFPNLQITQLVVNNKHSDARHHIVDLKFIPGSSPQRIAVVFQTGHIVTFIDAPTVNAFQLLIDISDRVFYEEPTEVGLMGIEFDPNFQQNRYFYVKYTKPSTTEGTNSIILSRFQSSETNLYSASPLSERIIFDVPRPGIHHHSGPPTFADDGLLYIPIGDGTTCCGPRELVKPSRNLTNLLGKILRVDVRASAALPNNAPGPLYTIPPSNPFAGNNSVRQEIWSFGFRNPWRLTWDPQLKQAWLADVGEKAWEEINIALPGGDYGWNAIEGNVCFSTSNCAPLLNPETYKRPVFVHPHPDQCASGLPCLSANALIGGYWYRGNAIPSLQGKYVYADWESGSLFSLTLPDRAMNPLLGAQVELVGPLFNPPLTVEFHPASFAEDPQGEIYVMNWSTAQIFKIVEEGPAPGGPVAPPMAAPVATPTAAPVATPMAAPVSPPMTPVALVCPTTQQPPAIADPPLSACKKFQASPGSCCDAALENREVYYPRGRLLVDSTATKCRTILGQLLCASCNPNATRIFGGDEPHIWPYLCMPFCQRFYDLCADIGINTNSKIYIPIRIPGVPTGNGTLTIRSRFPTVDGYCSQFGSIDAGSCHTY